MLDYLKNFVDSFSTGLEKKLKSFFNTKHIEPHVLHRVEELLISCDISMPMIKKIMDEVSQRNISNVDTMIEEIKNIMVELLSKVNDTCIAKEASIYMIVGVNGGGKTSFSAKLASHHKSLGKKVLLVAADTFRAAAVQQLESLGKLICVDVCKGEPTDTPASVVFKACQIFQQGYYDIMIIDTAGRMQTKNYLMEELAKLSRVLNKQLPEFQVSTIQVVDGLLGQNSFVQVSYFRECVHIDGVALTKIDSPSKGGIIFSIVDELKIPVLFISFGERMYEMAPFEISKYVDAMVRKL